MYYYAHLDENNIVDMIVALPTPISVDRYISIPTNDQTLVGKRYNSETGEFEEVIMYYYAVLGDKDIVTEVISSETEITDPNKISIPSNNTALVGKWYNRETGEFLDPPIHILADHTTQQINIANQEKWLQTELNEMNQTLASHTTQQANLVNQDNLFQTELNEMNQTLAAHTTQQANLATQDNLLQAGLNESNNKIKDLEQSTFGGYKCSFSIRDNQEVTSAWANSGKNFSFSFNTGLPGYFPKMIRIVDKEDTLVADFYIVKNADGSVKYAYLNKTFLGISKDSESTTPAMLMRHYEDMDDMDAIVVGRHSDGSAYNEGGAAFFQSIFENNSYVNIGNFNYTENTFTFDVDVSSNLVGYNTKMKLTGYVF